ncbi:uncharacterized protein Bfra_009373 [Botrytis fragariae]|uniref:Uncharacterized protein n=1 Tax=Botrytis fragariae TaxID=1964551 RepID=A0A8H6ANR5_9HELO|nr:uncharacterized protein Bfra_009373 [Botrytis fragariae]KAF5870819.1 hypothetical protein Bfra_009373 [Botrytis fragariae]
MEEIYQTRFNARGSRTCRCGFRAPNAAPMAAHILVHAACRVFGSREFGEVPWHGRLPKGTRTRLTLHIMARFRFACVAGALLGFFGKFVVSGEFAYEACIIVFAFVLSLTALASNQTGYRYSDGLCCGSTGLCVYFVDVCK